MPRDRKKKSAVLSPVKLGAAVLILILLIVGVILLIARPWRSESDELAPVSSAEPAATQETAGETAVPETEDPIPEITEEPASDRLLKASAVMDTELLIVPAKNLPAKSSALSTIPTMLQRVPYAPRTFGSLIFS